MYLPVTEAEYRALDAKCAEPESPSSKRAWCVAQLSAQPPAYKAAFLMNSTIWGLANLVRCALEAGVSPDSRRGDGRREPCVGCRQAGRSAPACQFGPDPADTWLRHSRSRCLRQANRRAPPPHNRPIQSPFSLPDAACFWPLACLPLCCSPAAASRTRRWLCLLRRLRCCTLCFECETLSPRENTLLTHWA